MAALLAVGGIAGARKSPASLYAGLGLAAAFAVSGGLIQSGEAEKGHLLATATSVLLVGAMGKRYAATRKIMPAGLLCGLGVASAGYEGYKAYEWLQ